MQRPGSNGRELRADAVFEGGGVKGIGLVGALAVAEERGHVWQNVAGTSAGAIVAALVAAGYTAAEIKGVMDGLDFNRLRDRSMRDRVPLVGPVLSMLVEKGLYEGDFFEGLMTELLAAKGVRTFGDLVIAGEEEERYRWKLSLVASDLSGAAMLVLPRGLRDYGIDPDAFPVGRAVRMSMSIPVFYEPVHLRHRNTGRTHYVVDGGILSNFPVWLFDSPGIPEWPTFGFRLRPGPEREVYQHIRGPISYVLALFGTMASAHDARYVEDSHTAARTVHVDPLDVGTTEFDITPERKELLYQSGRRAAEEFFATWDFEAYKAAHRARRGAPSA